MAIRGRLFKYIFSFILAFSILFLSIPLKAAAEVSGDVSADISAPVAENFIYTGTSTYKIPIEVPPGRRGIAPNIALVYNSAQGGGWAGVGWGLDMGSIQRSTKRGVNYDGNSYVAVINGSTVELRSREDWGPNYYGAKIEGAFFKFYHNTGNNSWTVTAKDGTKYYYGRQESIYDENTQDQTVIDNAGFNAIASRQTNPFYPQETGQVFKWLLDKVIDTNGNYMTITYSNDKGMLYLSRIDYTGNGSLEPTNKVIFDRIKDVDPEKSETRLNLIKVYADGHLVRKYDLNYTPSDNTGRLLLKEIFLYGSNGTTSLVYDSTGTQKKPISSFTYQTTPLSFEEPVGFPFSTSGKTIVSGDFNGDARSDIALINGSGVKVYLSQGGSFSNDGEWINSVSSTYSCQPEEGCFTEYEGHSGDFDGDGKADLLVVIRHKDSEGNHIRYSAGGDYVPAPALVYYAENSTFSAPLEFGNNPLASYSVGDVNGDGRADIVSGNSASLSQGRSFSGTVGCNFRFTLCLNSLNSSQTWAGDINGDGKSDVLSGNGDDIGTSSVMIQYSSGDSLIPGPTINNPTLNGNLAIGDFNGDGRADIVNVTSTDVNILLSEGKSFKTPAQWFNNSQDPATFAVPGDFNGDGKSDLLVQGTSGNATVYYSKGGIPDLLQTAKME